jgi:hypothetical protein
MVMALTSEQITDLHKKHGILVNQIREAAGRLGDIDATLRDGEPPDGKSLDEIGKPIREQP